MERALELLPIPGWDARSRQVEFLSSGGTYAAWKVADSSGVAPSLVVRVAHRSEMPRPIAEEVLALEELRGTGLAADLWHYDADSGNPLGAPYLVTSYIEGRPPLEWTPASVDAVMDTVARLHRITETPGGSSGIAWFEESRTYWERAAPLVIDDAAISDLVDRCESFVRAREGVFERLQMVARVHGDLVATNVVFGEGTARLIDWEWSQIDDPARDLALIGGQSYGGPWYVPMTDREVSVVVEHYARVRGLSSRQRDDLATRRDVWMVMDRLFTSVHFTVFGDSDQRVAALTMRSTLDEWLSVSRSVPST